MYTITLMWHDINSHILVLYYCCYYCSQWIMWYTILYIVYISLRSEEVCRPFKYIDDIKCWSEEVCTPCLNILII
jgi:hypothetical protein